MQKLLLHLLLFISVFSSCTNDSTTIDVADLKKVKIDSNIVYYPDGDVTKEDAKKLADYLARAKFLGDMAQTSELSMKNGNYELRIAFNKDDIDNQAKLLLWKFQYELSESVFDKQKVKIILTDKKFNDIAPLGPIARVKVEEVNAIYYNNKDFTKEQAKKLADFFIQDEYFSGDNAKDIFLTMENNVPTVRFIVNKDAIMKDEDKYIPLFSYIMEQMRNDVFDKSKANVVLTSVHYEDIKTVPLLTNDQRKQMENQSTTENNKNQQNMVDSVSEETTSSGVIRFKNN